MSSPPNSRNQVFGKRGPDVFVVQLVGAILPGIDPMLAGRENHQIAGRRTLPAAAAISLPGG